MQTPGVPALIDTHSHLDDPSFRDDLDEVLENSRAAGVFRFINIGYSPESWELTRALHQRHHDVEVVLGLHPQEAARFDTLLAQNLRRIVQDVRPVAVGEIGLDFFRSGPSRPAQIHAFRAQLELAATEGLPAVIHQRSASADLIEVLDAWADSVPLVLHSFDGTLELANWARERRCYIGIGGLAAKPGAGELRTLLQAMPTDRLVLETDSPYLAPPGTAARRNTPVQLPRIAAILAPLWNLSVEDLCQITTRNAVTAFRLTPADRTVGKRRDDADESAEAVDRDFEPRKVERVQSAPAARH